MHCCLIDQIFEVSSRHTTGGPGDQCSINIGSDGYILHVMLQDFDSASNIREVDSNMAIKSAWTSQCLVKGFRIVRGGDEDDTCAWTEAIELGQKLIQGLLRVGRISSVSLAANCIQFVNKDDTWSLVPGLGEQVANTFCAHANVELV